MVFLTEELLRKRAEHNEGRLADLEEVSLHQLHIEGIGRVLGNCCPMLEIIYLQNNLIPKIEHLRRLKSIKYLNLAVNNVQRIEGLERNENLEKLDLTVNFVDCDGLLTIERLRRNFQLKELYLVGNPCTRWDKYRSFVIGTLPKLKKLDGQDITATERIIASQELEAMRAELVELAKYAAAQRGMEWQEDEGGEEESESDDDDDGGGEGEDGEKKNQKTSKWTPQTRIRDYKREVAREAKAEKKKEDDKRRQDPFYAEKIRIQEQKEEDERSGRQRQRNEGKWDFHFEDNDNELILSIGFPKFLDTSQIDVDVQPKFITCKAKGKVIALELPMEVRPDATSAARSMSTGALVLTMPRTEPIVRPGGGAGGGGGGAAGALQQQQQQQQAKKNVEKKVGEHSEAVDYRHLSGIADGFSDMDIRARKAPAPAPVPQDFEDDPDVPPLE